MNSYLQALSLFILPLSAVVLIALQNKIFGFLLLAFGSSLVLFCPKSFRKHIILIYIGLAILGLSPINTGIQPFHVALLSFLLVSLIIIPYAISRFIYQDHLITFSLHKHFSWNSQAFGYLTLTALIAYLAFPWLMKFTGSYHNWTVLPGFGNLLLLFLGTNLLGIWDELFFINTVLGILRHHLPFYLANLIQAVLFTSFLYELGFRGIFFLVIFSFALLQGYIFKKTASLMYIITIHLIADFVLYLTLLHLHHPTWLQIFIS